MKARARISWSKYIAIVTAMVIMTLVAVVFFSRNGKSEASIMQVDGAVNTDVVGI